MSNLTSKKKLNTLFKDNLGLVNTNSDLNYYDEINTTIEYRNTVDISDVIIDHVVPNPTFPSDFDATYTESRFGYYNINLNTDSTKKYEDVQVDSTQTVMKFTRLKLEQIGTSVDINGGSYYCLDNNNNNVLENIIPYTHGIRDGVLDPQYEQTVIEYKIGTSYKKIILQANYHGNPIINHRQGLVTFNTNPAWALNTNSDAVSIENTNQFDGLYITFYKYVGKKGIRVLNSTDVSGGLVVGGEYSGTTAPNDGAIIQGKVGIGTLSPHTKLHISDNSALEGVKISHINLTQWISVGWNGIVKNSTSNSGSFTLGLVNNNDLKFITNDTEKMIIKKDGNVGIGTTTPGALLHVNSAILSTPITFAENQDKPYLIAGTSNGWTGENTDWNTYGFQHKFKTNSERIPRISIDDNLGERFTIKSGGNVGINKTDPQYKLDVNGSVRIKSQPLTLDTVDEDNEGGELRIGSYTSGSLNGYWTFDSYSDKLRIFGTSNLQGGGTALLINADPTEGLNKVGINRGWNYSQTEALDVSGNIRIDNSKINRNTQGGQLIFDNAWNKPGPNKIVLSGYGRTSNSSGFGIDDSTLKYISGSSTHKWYHSGNTSSNGTLGMSLEGKSLTVEEHITGKGNLTLPTHKLSDNTYGVYNSSSPTLTFQGYTTDDFSTTGNVVLKINNNATTQIQLSSNSDSYFMNNVAIGTPTPDQKLHVVGNMKLNGNLNIVGSGIINTTVNISQTATAGINTFSIPTTFGGNNIGVKINNSLNIGNKIRIGNSGNLSNNGSDPDLLFKTGNSPVIRMCKYGEIQFTDDLYQGTTWGNSTSNYNWRIKHVVDNDNDGMDYADCLKFQFKTSEGGGSKENTPLVLCPAKDTNGNYHTDISCNAVFNGDVLIRGSLLVSETATTQQTIVETTQFNGDFVLDGGNDLYLGSTSNIHFDATSSTSGSVYNTGEKIYLYPKVSIGANTTSPGTDNTKGILTFNVPSSGAHMFYTNSDITSNDELRLRIDKTNNVVVGKTSSNDITHDGLSPSLLNIYDGLSQNSETTIQFRNKDAKGIRIGIPSNTDGSKFSIMGWNNSADEHLFSVDTTSKKVGINTLTPCVHNVGHTNALTVANNSVLDVNGNIIVNYNNVDAKCIFGKLQIGEVRNTSHVGFSHIDSSSYGVAHADNGTLHLNGISSGIFFNISDAEKMKLTASDFTIGTVSSNNVNITHYGTTQHTGNMTIAGDLSVTIGSHTLLMDTNNNIKLDNVVVNGNELDIGSSLSGNNFNSTFNSGGTGNTIIRGGSAAANISIGDTNTDGKIYLGLAAGNDFDSINSSINDNYHIQSKTIAISSDNSNDSLYTAGDINVNGDLNVINASKALKIGDNFTVGVGTGNLITSGTFVMTKDSDSDIFIIKKNTNTNQFAVNGDTGKVTINTYLEIGNSIDIGSSNFTVDSNGSVVSKSTLSIDGVATFNEDINLIDKSLTIKDDSNPPVTKIQLKSDGDIIGNWKGDIITTDLGGTGADNSSPSGATAGDILVRQGDGTYQNGKITALGGIQVIRSDTGITIENTDKGSNIVLPVSNSSQAGTMSDTDFTAVSLIKDFMLKEGISLDSQSDAKSLKEGLVRKVTNYRMKTHYNYDSNTMKPLYLGSFFYDPESIGGTKTFTQQTYSDYDMGGIEIDLVGPNFTVSGSQTIITNHSQETGSDYRVLFWQDYTPSSPFSHINIEFNCFNEVDFNYSNYKYNSIMCINETDKNPINETFLSTSNIDNIRATGKTQEKNGVGPRGQLFPLHGHYNNVNINPIRILILINKVDVDTDTGAKLNFNSKSACLKITELSDNS